MHRICAIIFYLAAICDHPFPSPPYARPQTNLCKSTTLNLTHPRPLINLKHRPHPPPLPGRQYGCIYLPTHARLTSSVVRAPPPATLYMHCARRFLYHIFVCVSMCAECARARVRSGRRIRSCNLYLIVCACIFRRQADGARACLGLGHRQRRSRHSTKLRALGCAPH